MDFREGGHWLYCMVGPDDANQWCRGRFQKRSRNIIVLKIDAFCDETGNIKRIFLLCIGKEVLQMLPNDGTKVEVEITYSSKEDMEKML